MYDCDEVNDVNKRYHTNVKIMCKMQCQGLWYMQVMHACTTKQFCYFILLLHETNLWLYLRHTVVCVAKFLTNINYIDHYHCMSLKEC